MKTEIPDERVVVFLDGSNFFYALRDEFHDLYIDFLALVKKLVGQRKLICTNYYTAMPDQKKYPDRYIKKMHFVKMLKELNNFEVIFGRLELHKGTYIEKGVDLALSTDLLDLAYQNIYDTAIIISGNGDLTRSIGVVQRLGKLVENAAAASILSPDLRDLCDKFVLLDDEFLKDCWRPHPTCKDQKPPPI